MPHAGADAQSFEACITMGKFYLVLIVQYVHYNIGKQYDHMRIATYRGPTLFIVTIYTGPDWDVADV